MDGTPTGRGPGSFVEIVDDLLASDPGGGLFAHDVATGEERLAVPLTTPARARAAVEAAAREVVAELASR